MSRHSRISERPRFFRGSEWLRLAGMMGLLAVLVLMIARAREPDSWRFLSGERAVVQLAGDAPDGAKPFSKVAPPATKPPDKPEDATAASSSSAAVKDPAQKDAPVKDAAKVAPDAKLKTPVRGEASPKATLDLTAPPATDLDPEEVEAALEEFQALSDGGLFNRIEEMPAYNRFLKWVANQSFSQLAKRSPKHLLFTQFYQSPDKYRGDLVELKLSVRRIIKYAEKAPNGEPLFELWGVTNESKSWPYEVVVVGLPPDMPIGTDVNEDVTFVGYYLKQQGYQPANAKPNAPPLVAPLLIGRAEWRRPAQSPVLTPGSKLWWIVGTLLFAFVIVMAVRIVMVVRRPRLLATNVPRPTTAGNEPVEDWLHRAEEIPEQATNNGNGVAHDWDDHDSAEAEHSSEHIDPPWDDGNRG